MSQTELSVVEEEDCRSDVSDFEHLSVVDDFVRSLEPPPKIALAKVFPSDHSQAAVTVYVLLDDQSNHTLARSDLLNKLGVTSDPVLYRPKSCAGVTETT